MALEIKMKLDEKHVWIIALLCMVAITWIISDASVKYGTIEHGRPTLSRSCDK